MEVVPCAWVGADGAVVDTVVRAGIKGRCREGKEGEMRRGKGKAGKERRRMETNINEGDNKKGNTTS